MANIITPPKSEKVSNNMTIEQYIAHLLFLLFFGLFGVCMAQWGQKLYEVALNFLGQFIGACMRDGAITVMKFQVGGYKIRKIFS